MKSSPIVLPKLPCLLVSLLHGPRWFTTTAAQLFNQFVATAQARDQRTKKANTDAAVEETRQECRVFLER